jgi:pyruvate dehydrogenase E2 component (dihydrolipoamide acetyltransferase)
MSVATATEIVMPQLSDSMEEGTVLSWLVEAGQRIEAGDDLLEVETDKANMTVQAEASGVLEILAEEGSTHPVGATIARLGPGPGAQPPSAPVEPDPEPAPAASSDAPAPAAEAATPLARRAAAIHGVALASVSAPSGLGGRVTKADVLAAAGIAAPPPAPVAEPPAPPARRAAEPAETTGATSAKGEVSVQEPSRLQAVIARRMAESKGTVPHFQVETEVSMEAAIELRRELAGVAGEQPVPSLNDLIVRAAALALRRHPKVNGSYRDGRFELHERVNVGVAVAAEDALVVPTIFDADRKSLGEIGRDSRRLAERVRSGEVTPPELAGGTFTVSNLGMFGMSAIYPVINVPQAAILGVGTIRPVLRREADGSIGDASLMTLTLSCDHRILYGAEAAMFLAEVRDHLQAPLLVAF